MPFSEYKAILKKLENGMGIKRGMLNLYRKALATDKNEMSTKLLIAAAKVLGIEPEKLINPKYKKLIEDSLGLAVQATA